MENKRLMAGLGVSIGIGIFIISFPISIMVYYTFFGPATPEPPATSPDGRLHAYITLRGALDTYNATLYIQRGHKPPERLMRRVTNGDLKWSPDSRKIAIVRSGDLGSVIVEVVDTVSRTSDNAYWDYPTKDPDNRPKLCCVWQGSNSLICGYYSGGKTVGPTQILRVIEKAGHVELGEQR